MRRSTKETTFFNKKSKLPPFCGKTARGYDQFAKTAYLPRKWLLAMHAPLGRKKASASNTNAQQGIAIATRV